MQDPKAAAMDSNWTPQGELREGEPCLVWCPGATIPAWACTRYKPETDIRNGGDTHYLPQPPAPEGK